MNAHTHDILDIVSAQRSHELSILNPIDPDEFGGHIIYIYAQCANQFLNYFNVLKNNR
jgi:hypothetical protein